MSKLRKFLVLALMLGLSSVVGASQACCVAPNYYMTVSIVGTPICNYHNNTGRVDWRINYHLPSNASTTFYSYGDGVNQGADFYADLPHTAGASVDTFSSYSIWDWAIPEARPRGSSFKVRIQFQLQPDLNGFEDWALIVFDCTAGGATNIAVHNGGFTLP